MLVDAAEIAKDLEIPPTFEAEPRLRRRKKQFAYEAEDEPVQDPKQNFKVNFFFAILDTAIRSVEERFEQMRTIESVFGFLYHIHGLQIASDLCGELQSIARRLSEETKSPQDVFRFILCQNLEDSLPNLCIALRILLTLPVSVASGELSSSISVDLSLREKIVKWSINVSRKNRFTNQLHRCKVRDEICQRQKIKRQKMDEKEKRKLECELFKLNFNEIINSCKRLSND
ncbi:uncharacterized protein LOC136092857 [Hydra vulgaris]|uniref:uncharacterized protein LOC136092857 n=1 Tax=Hydra vulgaris TaxID=6087 RepID=UPI0032EA5A02